MMNVRGPSVDALRRVPVFLVLVVLGAAFAAAGGLGGSLEGLDSGGERAGRPLAPAGGVWFEEVVTAPVTDWGESGSVTSSDEYIVLRNHGEGEVDLTDWVLHMIDGTDESLDLEGVLAPNEARLVLNPRGAINNDVRLVLVDGAGVEVDNVTLGENGVALGTKKDRFDEAVHLVGPWAGLRGPGTLGRGEGPLPAFWVSHIAPRGNIGSVSAYDSPWVRPDNLSLDLRLRVAPDRELGLFSLRVEGRVVDLSPVDGESDVWRSDPFSVASSAGVPITVQSDDLAVGSFPDASPLVLQIDDEPPRFEPEDGGSAYAVADGDGRIHWFPPVAPGPSGLASATVFDSLESRQELTDCVPLEAPGPECRVGPDADSVGVVLRDGAGHTVETPLSVVLLDGPPDVPTISFLSGPPPTLRWDGTSRPLERIGVESAHNDTGAAPVRSEQLAGDAVTFVDAEWEPGGPRAYRLTITDRAGNTATGNWTPLDPESVPVQFEVQHEDAPLLLATTGEAEVVARFDRDLAEPPRLSLRLDRPVAVHEQIDAEALLSGSSYSYRVRLPSPMPEGEGAWSFVGGQGLDGAPLSSWSHNVSWDEEAPHAVLGGEIDGWIQGDHHEFTVTGVDGIDPSPRVSFDAVPANVSVSDSMVDPRLTVDTEGVFQVTGEVEDASGNRRTFAFDVALDGTPPSVVEVERPSRWSESSPLRLQIRDPLSGVDASGLVVWIRNATQVHEARIMAWDNDTVLLVPGNDTSSVKGPFEVYVAVSDVAGNEAEGLLSGRLERRHGGANATGETMGSQTVRGQDEDPVDPQSAPRFLDAPWESGFGEKEDGAPKEESERAATGGTDQAQGASRSAWDDFSWDQVPSGGKQRSVGWALLTAAGLVGLGTAVHQVHRRRRRTEPAPPPSKRDEAKDTLQPVEDGDLPEEDSPGGDDPVVWETVPLLVGDPAPPPDVNTHLTQMVVPDEHAGRDDGWEVPPSLPSPAASGFSFVVVQSDPDSS